MYIWPGYPSLLLQPLVGNKLRLSARKSGRQLPDGKRFAISREGVTRAPWPALNHNGSGPVAKAAETPTKSVGVNSGATLRGAGEKERMLAEVSMARVLLVEDNPLLRWVLRTSLVMDGYDVSAPASSREAVELGRTTPFDVVITDLTILPGPDGFAVVEEIRQKYPTTHFILISAQADDELADRARHAGVERVIEKPFPIDLIHSAVRELIPQEHSAVSEL